MVLVLSGCIVPVAALLCALWWSVGRSEQPGPRQRAGDLRPWSVGRWEGLAEEMTRRGDRARPRCSDAATRRRHLAAVLPGDARS